MSKIPAILILSVAAGLLVIGIHQTMINGLEYSYWIFMLSLSLLFLYRLKKPKNPSSGK